MAKSNRQMFTSLLTLYRPLINELNVHLAKYNLFSSQWGIIRILKHEEPLSFQAIAKATNIEKPSASSLIHKLISLGYVDIIEGSDKRTKLVRLSTAGELVYEEVESMIDEWVASLFDGISEENQITITQALDIIKRNLI
ncbi:MarR family transcriptional regulator [Bacillus sp. T3]|uniref:MarR family winged helix-turn-helix transcriptional regulator n=1 Tax=Bacillus sp. T3 TaxID=467262 RepID=UPI002981D92C|nr:MarR family transcriptional regulator [Bacillus sp. T3]